MILTIIQARLGSTRLPGKILLPIAGKSILQHVYDAASEPKVVAMPSEDRATLLGLPLMDLKGQIMGFDGDPNDVLGRFYYTWQDFNPEADWILRLTADCPMLTREIVERFIRNWIGQNARYDQDGYLCLGFHLDANTIYTNRPYDPDGYDMELFSVEALKMAHEHATEPYDREHVTAWMYRHLNVRRFSVFGREPQPENPAEKVSVDTQEDYEKVKKLMEGK